MTPDERRTQTAQSIARATAAVERARAAADRAEKHANDAPHLDKTLIALAYRADRAAGDAYEARGWVESCARYATHSQADPAQADKDVNSASYHARQAETAADRAEKAAAAARQAAAANDPAAALDAANRANAAAHAAGRMMIDDNTEQNRLDCLIANSHARCARDFAAAVTA